MNQSVCPSCGEDLKKAGFYFKQSANYVWDDEEQRHVVEEIFIDEILTRCCGVEVEDVIENVQPVEEYYKK